MKTLFFVLLLISQLSWAQKPELAIPRVAFTQYKKIQDIPCPTGFIRTRAATASFGEYLRNLPTKQANNRVYLHNGQLKANQKAQFAVIKMDVGKRDLQQCADAVMRLRAEYLFSQNRKDDIHFNFVNGMRVGYAPYANGYRMRVKGSKSWWVKSAKPSNSYPTFRRYLNLIFAYAGTASLAKELTPVASTADMQIGDVFIVGGHPGHCVIVVDMAQDKQGRKLFMLAQGYMPAQEIHVLRNPASSHSPWYYLVDGEKLISPEYLFKASDLRRF